MKSLLTMMSLCLIGLVSLHAQPIITAETVFKVGDFAPIKYENGFWNPGDSGNDVSWDFSGLSATKTWDWEAMNPAGTMFADSFPTANLAFRFPEGNTSENWVYYHFLNDSLNLLGGASLTYADSSVFYFMLNENPDLIAIFPFTYQDSHSDVVKGITRVNIAGFDFTARRGGETTRIVDATGTLTTPYGTFQNVVRVKTTEAIRDSVSVPIPTVSHQSITRYTWYSADERYVLLHMDSMANQGGVTYQYFYRSGEITTGIEEEQFAAKINLNVYPNPASEQITISFEGESLAKTKISLKNMIGQELKSIIVPYLSHGVQTHQFDLQGIGSGYYSISIETSKGIAVKKIFIQ